MRVPRRNRALLVALWANAALMAMILVALLARSPGGSMLPAAWAQQPPIAGGAGIFVMPGQTGPNQWGCYLMDVDSQTLCVYQYYPGEHQFRLEAARNFRWDRKLARFNTDKPTPNEVKALVEKEQANLNAGAGEKPR